MKTYKVIFLDTETTGICDMRTPYNEETLRNTWPYITQFAYQVCHITEDLLTSTQEAIKVHKIKPVYSPDLYSEEAMLKTGISYNELLNGDEIVPILHDFISELNTADFVVAHNTTFDMKVIKAEFLRHGIDQHMRVCPWIDTMYHGNTFCNLRNSRGGRKFPTLSELYKKITDSFPPVAHKADADLTSLKVCFFGLIKNNILTQDRIANRIASHVSSNNVFE